MRWTPVLLGVVLVLLSAGAASGSVAAPAAVTVDNPDPELKTDGDGWKVTVGVTNITDAPVTLLVRSRQPVAGGTCKVMFGKSAVIDPATQADVDVTYSSGCEVGDGGVAFTIRPGVQHAQSAIPITATAKKRDKVEWGVLWWFVYGMGGALFVLFVACFFLGADPKIEPGTELKHLPATWSFSDSWVSNVTVLGGALTSVVGLSDTVKAILGEDADTAIARATVSAAIAAAIIGLGAIVLQIAKRKGSFTVAGLVAAGAVTVGAAFGELYIVWKTAEKLELDGLQNDLAIPFCIVSVLLGLYAVRNLRETIRAGIKAPTVVVPETAIVAAALLGELEEGRSDPKVLIAAVKNQLEAAAAAKQSDAVAVQAAVEAGTMMTTLRQRPTHAAML